MMTLGNSGAVRIALAITALPRSEAMVLASMYAFLPYLALLTWNLAEECFVSLPMMTAVGVASWGRLLGVA